MWFNAPAQFHSRLFSVNLCVARYYWLSRNKITRIKWTKGKKNTFQRNFHYRLKNYALNTRITERQRENEANKCKDRFYLQFYERLLTVVIIVYMPFWIFLMRANFAFFDASFAKHRPCFSAHKFIWWFGV